MFPPRLQWRDRGACVARRELRASTGLGLGSAPRTGAEARRRPDSGEADVVRARAGASLCLAQRVPYQQYNGSGSNGSSVCTHAIQECVDAASCSGGSSSD